MLFSSVFTVLAQNLPQYLCITLCKPIVNITVFTPGSLLQDIYSVHINDSVFLKCNIHILNSNLFLTLQRASRVVSRSPLTSPLICSSSSSPQTLQQKELSSYTHICIHQVHVYIWICVVTFFESIFHCCDLLV